MMIYTISLYFIICVLVEPRIVDAFSNAGINNQHHKGQLSHRILCRKNILCNIRPLTATAPQTEEIFEHKHLSKAGKAACLLGIWVNFFFFAKAVAMGSMCITPPAFVTLDLDALTIGHAAAVVAALHLAAGSVLLSELFDMKWVTPWMVRTALSGSFLIAAFGIGCF